MGTLGDNLLKLTEFPFSYSFIGLLAAIFGQGWNYGDPEFFNRLGPLLILMGFVATTLALTDPIGALQKIWLRRIKDKDPIHKNSRTFLEQKIEDELYNIDSKSIYLYRVRCFTVFGVDFQYILPEPILASLAESFLRKMKSDKRAEKFDIDKPIDEMEEPQLTELRSIAESLRERTLRTTWIAREIDKITSMIYFIIVIGTFVGVFIFSLVSDFAFEDEFLTIFQDDDVRALWASIIILIFSIGALVGIFYRLGKRGKELKGNVLVVFRYLAIRESYNIVRRTIGFEAKNTSSNDETSKPSKVESFDKSLQAVEQYLTNGDWTLAEITLEHTKSDYEDLYVEKAKDMLVVREQDARPS